MPCPALRPCMAIIALAGAACTNPAAHPPPAEGRARQAAWERAELRVYAGVEATQAAVRQALALDTSAAARFRGRYLVGRAMIHAHDTALPGLLRRMDGGTAPEAAWAALLRATEGIGQPGDDDAARTDSLLDLAERMEPADPVLRHRIQLTRMRSLAKQQRVRAADSLLMGLEGSLAQDTALLAEAIGIQGKACLEAGQPAAAVTRIEEAIRLASQKGPSQHLAEAWLNLAYAQTELGDYTESARCAAAADSLFGLMGNSRDRILALDVLGYSYWGVLPPGTELALWRHAAALADSLHEPGKGALVHLDIARFFVGCDSACASLIGTANGTQYDSARVHARITRQVAEDQQDQVLSGRSMKIETAILNRQGQYARSNEVCRRALPIFERAGNQKWVCATLLDIASNLISLKDWPAAARTLDQALGIAAQHGFVNLRMLALNRLQFVRKQQGRPAEALALLEDYHAVKDSIEGMEVAQRLAQLDLRHRYAQEALADSLAHAAALDRERQRSGQQIKRWYTLLGGTLLLLGGAVLLFLLDRKRRRERYGKEIAQLRMQALRLRMDPHFIGNALHAVNGYLLNNEPHAASDLLSRFARWIRATLENNRLDAVPLGDELEAARTYLALEQARTSGKFSFAVEAPADELLLRTKVPPMLVQPLLENAVLHGITPMEGHGHVLLRVQDEEEALLITVQDDGVGRKGAGSSAEHASLSARITAERLALLGQHARKGASMRVVDLPQGTRVEIRLPVP